MNLSGTIIVIIAAFLHAGWNTALHGSIDKLWSMAIMCMAIAFISGISVIFIDYPATACFPWLLLSALLHICYNLLLVRTYKDGDLGQTYPIARGLSPIFVLLGAAAFARETPGFLTVIGVILVAVGVVMLAFKDKPLATSTVSYAFGTGFFIGAYSVADGLGARMAGHSISYVLWLCLLWSVAMLLIYIGARNWRSLRRSTREMLTAAGGGAVSILSYGIVVQAMSFGPMGPVSALRETSVVFAAVLGHSFLHERFTIRRLIACIIVAFGAICVGFQNDI